MRKLLLLVALGLLGCGQEDSGTESGFPGRVSDLTPEAMFVDDLNVVWDGAAYSVVFVARLDGDPDLDRVTFLSRISTSGEVLTEPTIVSPDVNTDGKGFGLIVVEPAGSRPRYRIFYKDGNNDCWSLGFDSTAATEGPPTRHEDYCDGISGAATDAGTWGALYRDYQNNALRFIAPTGADVEIEPGTTPPYAPRLAWNPSRGTFLAAWKENGRIQTAELRPDGTVVAPSKVLLDDGTDQSPAILALDGEQAIVCWWADSNMQFLAMDGAGTALWSAPRALLPRNRAESLDLDMTTVAGQAYLSWQGDSETSLPQIYDGRVDLADGALVDAHVVSDGVHWFGRPQIAAGPDGQALIFEGTVAGSERVYVAVP